MTELENFHSICSSCTTCKLATTRKNVVFGAGNPDAQLMIIGESPGEDEDKTGRPFVCRAGQLLDQIRAAVLIPRESVYIANIVKCRPPGNRNPEIDEIAACEHLVARANSIDSPADHCDFGECAYTVGDRHKFGHHQNPRCCRKLARV
jgi:uracil-DNA glycosylase